jgi:hypothetical protein
MALQKLWTFIGLFGLVWSAWATQAATFNFMFNNTEQGPNSKASSVLNTKDPSTAQVVQTTTDEDGNTTTTTSTAPETDTIEIGETTASSEALLAENSIRRHHLRFGLSFSGSTFDEDQLIAPGAQLEYTYSLHSILGITGFGNLNTEAWTGGLELDLVPLRLDVFGKEDFMEAAVMAGGMLSGDYEGDEGLRLAPHLGLRATINWTDSVGFVSSLRWSDFHLGTDGSNLTGLAGIAFRF